jgi:hypothetical protein
MASTVHAATAIEALAKVEVAGYIATEASATAKAIVAREGINTASAIAIEEPSS